MNYLWIKGGRGQSASANTWCWYFSGCRYKGLVSISGNHLIPDARHCHHFEVRYVRPGNKIFYENNSDGMLQTQYLPFHEEFNIECDEGPLKVQLNHMSDHNSDLYLKKKHTNLEPWNDQSYKPLRGFRAFSQEYGNWCSQRVDWAVKNFFF